MNAVGIDVSKDKSTVAVLRPLEEIVVSPFDVSHNPKELSELVTLLKTLDGDTKVVMEYIGNNYLQIAPSLRNNGIFVSVVNPILVKDYSTKSLTVRKVKTDKKYALKIASFALDRWNELSPFSKQKALVGFAGLDAFPFQSGNFNPQYRPISKRGPAALRKMLLQVMSVILQNSPENNTVFQFWTRSAPNVNIFPFT